MLLILLWFRAQSGKLNCFKDAAFTMQELHTFWQWASTKRCVNEPYPETEGTGLEHADPWCEHAQTHTHTQMNLDNAISFILLRNVHSPSANHNWKKGCSRILRKMHVYWLKQSMFSSETPRDSPCPQALPVSRGKMTRSLRDIPKDTPAHH